MCGFISLTFCDFMNAAQSATRASSTAPGFSFSSFGRNPGRCDPRTLPSFPEIGAKLYFGFAADIPAALSPIARELVVVAARKAGRQGARSELKEDWRLKAEAGVRRVKQRATTKQLRPPLRLATS
jgi:hypothetical protein